MDMDYKSPLLDGLDVSDNDSRLILADHLDDLERHDEANLLRDLHTPVRIEDQKVVLDGRTDMPGTFLRGYLDACFEGTTVDNPDEPGGNGIWLDSTGLGVGDIAPETMTRIEADCRAFWFSYGDLIDDSAESAELAGYHFFMTRVGHGIGFWDGRWPEHGDELTEGAEAFGDFDLYIGDDGLIHGN